MEGLDVVRGTHFGRAPHRFSGETTWELSGIMFEVQNRTPIYSDESMWLCWISWLRWSAFYMYLSRPGPDFFVSCKCQPAFLNTLFLTINRCPLLWCRGLTLPKMPGDGILTHSQDNTAIFQH